MNQTKIVPGPGSYELRSKYKSNLNKRDQNSFHASTLAVSRKINPPSIPTDSLGYKCDPNNKVEKVQTKPVNTPAPGTYELRKDLLKQTGLVWTTGQTVSRKEDDPALPGPGHYNFKPGKAKAPTSSFRSEQDRFNPKKIKKTTQPGPGDYNPN